MTARRPNCLPPRSRHFGFSMVEVLVTMLIVSVGLLGLAALQVTSLRAGNSTTFRTQATLLANELAERMHANPTAVANNAFMAVDFAVDVNCAAPPAPYCEDSYNGVVVPGSPCSSAQLAAFDLNVWYCGYMSGGARAFGVVNQLPSPTATIACLDNDPADGNPCTAGSPHLIAVSWAEVQPDGNPDTKSVTFTMLP